MTLAVTSFTPTTGPCTGGTKIVITGTGLDAVEGSNGAVLIGGHEALIDTTATNTALSLTVISPPIANADAGAFKVTVLDYATPAEAQSSGSFTYTVVSSPVLTSTLTRKWALQIDTSVAQDGSTWTPVRGVKDFQPQLTPTMQDDSDYDSNGWGSDVKTMLKWSLVMKLARKMAAGFAEDPGQAKIRAAHDKFDSAGVVHVRWYDRNGTTEAYEGVAQVQWSEDGGDPTTLSMVSVTLTGQGVRTLIANPA